jgi:hypothetical protein
VIVIAALRPEGQEEDVASLKSGLGVARSSGCRKEGPERRCTVRAARVWTPVPCRWGSGSQAAVQGFVLARDVMRIVVIHQVPDMVAELTSKGCTVLHGKEKAGLWMSY